jgi:hypothetical protein
MNLASSGYLQYPILKHIHPFFAAREIKRTNRELFLMDERPTSSIRYAGSSLFLKLLENIRDFVAVCGKGDHNREYNL